MHIPQTWNQVFSVCIDDVDVPAFGDKPNLPPSRDAAFGDADRHSFFASAIPRIHHVDVGENEHLGVSLLRPGAEQRSKTQTRDQTCFHPQAPRKTVRKGYVWAAA